MDILTIIGFVIGILAGVFGILTGFVQLMEYFKKRRAPHAESKTSPQNQTTKVDNPFHQTNEWNLEFLSNEQLLDLSRLLDLHFNEGELKSLCFALSIDYENLAGQHKAKKVLELVKRMQRYGNIESLIFECNRLRPKIDWPPLQLTLTPQLDANNLNQTVREARDKYLHDIIEKYSEWKTRFTDLPISLQVTSVSVRPEMGLLIDLPSTINRKLDINEVIRQQKQIIVLGEPGSGKTTLMQKAAYDQSLAALKNESEPIPVLVRLADYTGGEDLIYFINRQVKMLSPILAQQLQNLIRANRIWLLLDGFDEVPIDNFKNSVQQIEEYLSLHTTQTIVITSRLSAYDNNFSLTKVTTQPLDASQRKKIYPQIFARYRG